MRRQASAKVYSGVKVLKAPSFMGVPFVKGWMGYPARDTSADASGIPDRLQSRQRVSRRIRGRPGRGPQAGRNLAADHRHKVPDLGPPGALAGVRAIEEDTRSSDGKRTEIW